MQTKTEDEKEEVNRKMVFERIKRAFRTGGSSVPVAPLDTCKPSVERFKDCRTYIKGMLLRPPERMVLTEIGKGRIAGSMRPAYIYNEKSDEHEAADALVEKGLATVTHTGKMGFVKEPGTNRITDEKGMLDKFELTEKGVCARDIAQIQKGECICQKEEEESRKQEGRTSSYNY